MICDDRLMLYEPLWKLGMYRKESKWHLNVAKQGKMLTLTFTTGEALEYANRRPNPAT
jgi:hypothetical protein